MLIIITIIIIKIGQICSTLGGGYISSTPPPTPIYTPVGFFWDIISFTSR